MSSFTKLFYLRSLFIIICYYIALNKEGTNRYREMVPEACKLAGNRQKESKVTFFRFTVRFIFYRYGPQLFKIRHDHSSVSLLGLLAKIKV